MTYCWIKGANYNFGLHVQVDVSRGGGSIIPFERMFALGIAEGVETVWKLSKAWRERGEGQRGLSRHVRRYSIIRF